MMKKWKKQEKLEPPGLFIFIGFHPLFIEVKKVLKMDIFRGKFLIFGKFQEKETKKFVILLPKKDCYFCILHSVNCDLSREKDIFLWTMEMISFVLGDAKRDLSGS